MCILGDCFHSVAVVLGARDHCSPLAADGSLLLCTPVDPLFMVLPYLAKAGKVCTSTCSDIPQFNTIMDSCTAAWLEVCF